MGQSAIFGRIEGACRPMSYDGTPVRLIGVRRRLVVDKIGGEPCRATTTEVQDLGEPEGSPTRPAITLFAGTKKAPEKGDGRCAPVLNSGWLARPLSLSQRSTDVRSIFRKRQLDGLGRVKLILPNKGQKQGLRLGKTGRLLRLWLGVFGHQFLELLRRSRFFSAF